MVKNNAALRETPFRTSTPRNAAVGYVVVAFAAMACILSATPRLAHGERYLAEFSDGARQEGRQLYDWYASNAAPRLDNTPLFGTKRQLRWLRDRQLTEGEKPLAMVETRLGDQLPGAVVGYQASSDQPLSQTPAHFIVAPACELRGFGENRAVRVLSQYVRRIVWQSQGPKRYTPSRLYFREGGSLAYRSLRWEDEKVVLLLDAGTRRVGFDEIAELHFPQQDPWEIYFDAIARSSPSIAAPFVRLHTQDGLVATSSLARFAAASLGDFNEPRNWVHSLQPVWSLDRLPVPHANITERLYFSAAAPPLSLFSPSQEKQSSLLGNLKWPSQKNRNARGGRLFTDGREFATGFGVFGNTALYFPLPGCAEAFSTRVGLDRLASTGGCAEARVFLASAPEQPLANTGVLLGGQPSVYFQQVALPKNGDPSRTLVLAVNPTPADAPQDADPFDIRDLVNWINPTLRLNHVQLQAEVDRRRISTVAAWRGWRVENPASLGWKVVANQAGGFRMLPYAKAEPLKLTRRVRPNERQRWLVLQIEQPNAVSEAKLIVRADGETIAKRELARNPSGGSAKRFVVSLESLQGRENVQLEIETPAGVAFDWRGMAFFKNPPFLYALLEDQASETQATLLAGENRQWRKNIRFYGESALQVRDHKPCKVVFARPVQIRQTPEVGEFRYLRFAYRKSGGGGVHWRITSAEGVREYRAGKGAPQQKGAINLWRLELPEHWIVATRDLFADFGAMEITAIEVESVGGKTLWLDHMHLANQLEDFQMLAAADPAVANRSARRLLAKNVLKKGRAAAVSLRLEDRIASGILISSTGEVLTAGHILGKAGENVAVTLPDGRTLKGAAVAISREDDLGLVRLNGLNDLPHATIAETTKIADDQLYVAFAFKADAAGKQSLSSPIVALREVTNQEIWTTTDNADWQAGAALLDRESRLIGIRSRPHSEGGFLYRRVNQNIVNRLRRGETWGTWPHGSGPTLGVTIETTAAGCLVTLVAPKSAAANAGLRAGDLLTQVDGAETRVLSDVYRILAARDPGAIIGVQWMHGGKPNAARLKLETRSP